MRETRGPIFWGEWGDVEDIEANFEKPGCLDGAEVLHAAYTGYDCWSDYEMEAVVVFTRDGKLWEVNGSHCSCMGLEGQWRPEEAVAKALAMRRGKGSGPPVVNEAFDAMVEKLVEESPK